MEIVWVGCHGEARVNGSTWKVGSHPVDIHIGVEPDHRAPLPVNGHMSPIVPPPTTCSPWTVNLNETGTNSVSAISAFSCIYCHLAALLTDGQKHNNKNWSYFFFIGFLKNMYEVIEPTFRYSMNIQYVHTSLCTCIMCSLRAGRILLHPSTHSKGVSISQTHPGVECLYTPSLWMFVEFFKEILTNLKIPPSDRKSWCNTGNVALFSAKNLPPKASGLAIFCVCWKVRHTCTSMFGMTTGPLNCG